MAAISVYYGAIVNPISIAEYALHPRALMAVNSNGDIAWIERDVDPQDVKNTINRRLPEVQVPPGHGINVSVIELRDGEFLLPGFVDTHTHAPQVPNMDSTASGGQYELLEWLKHVTYPMEGNFQNADFARKVYPNVVRRFISFGTTTCCYYGSSHLESTKVLADVVKNAGQRAFVGKCNMNRNCPHNVCEPSATEAVEETKEIISHIRNLNSDLVRPILTPRFAISCDGDLLSGLGAIAKSDETLAIQTHISENRAEIEKTLSLFPSRESYADVYDFYGLLTERTILAHGVHLDKCDLEIIKKRNAGISHCPTSNFNLSSGMAKVAEMLDQGIKVGLGTDVSGGFSPSILTAIQHASMCSKMVAIQSPVHPEKHNHYHQKDTGFTGKPLRIETLLYLATLGGASLCCLDSEIGSFEPGKHFDALIVSVHPETDNPAIWNIPEEHSETIHQTKWNATDRLEARLERFLFGGDDTNIMNIFVQGKCIGGKRAGRS